MISFLEFNNKYVNLVKVVLSRKYKEIMRFGMTVYQYKNNEYKNVDIDDIYFWSTLGMVITPIGDILLFQNSFF